MSKFMSLLKRNHEQDRVDVPSLHRKIHPNLNSLAAQLEDNQPDNVPQGFPFPFNPQIETNFMPLKPKPPERDRLNNAPTTSTIEAHRSQLEDNHTARVAYIPPFAPGDAWSTFGRGIVPYLPTGLEEEPTSASVLANNNHGTPVTHRYTHLQTPRSISRSSEASSPFSQSMPQNRNTPSSQNDTVSTSPTFEKSSSPASYYTFGRRPSSSHLVIETPPPLPPLDHPAFQSAIRTQDVPSSSDDTSNDPLAKHHPRHSASLPTMLSSLPVRSRTGSGASKSVRGARKRHYDIKSSQIDAANSRIILRPVNHDSQIPTKRLRSRSRSTHGSSVELNSREATDTEKWPKGEQAAGEPSDLATRVRETKTDDVSILGKTCGGNVALEEVSRLGDPFFLQTTVTHGEKPYLSFTHDITRSKQGESNTYEMSKPNAANHHNNNDQDGSKEPPSANSGIQGSATTVDRARKSSLPKRTPLPASESLFVPPFLSFTSPTPESSPISPFLPLQLSEKGSSSGSNPPALKSSMRRTTGKRKADDAEVEAGSPSKDSRRETRATFAPDRRPHRVSENSGSSHAPSSYHRKRARLSTSSDSRALSRSPTMTSLGENLGSATTGSWSSRGSKGPPVTVPHHHPSRQSMQSQRPSNYAHSQRPQRDPSRRRSLSGASIPLSALVSPHAPSIARSMTFHMHDPKRPGPIRSTSWGLSLPAPTSGGSRWKSEEWTERGGSPSHAWLFFLGFIFFPIWWIAAFMGIPRTRRIGEGETEKGVILDDPQVEYDYRSWRTRCRVMGVVSFFTYIPFIILVAIFVRH